MLSSNTTKLAGVLAALLAVAFLYNKITLYLKRQQFKKENGCLPPQSRFPIKDPIFAIDNMIANIKAARQHRLLETLQQRFNTYGNTFATKIAQRKFIFTTEPQNVKTILSLKFKDYGLGNREASLGPLLGQGIFTMTGDFWARSRAMIRPNFARDQVADIDAFERHIQRLWKLIPRDGSTVDMQELFFRFTIDSATEFLFGKSTHTLMDDDVGTTSGSDFAKAFNKAQHFCATKVRMGGLAIFLRDAEGEKAIKTCHEFVGHFVDEAIRYRESLDVEKKGEEKYVFLHELAKDTNDRSRLRDELLNVLLAGRDTTASLLSNMWFMIARDPAIFAKLRAEIDETLHGELPDYKALRDLKYLKYCMNESLRFHPVVPGNSRVAVVDTVLPLGGGPDGQSPLFVPANSGVAYSPWAMHRRTDYFGADADQFRPERWETLRPGWEYLPFNGGPRICLGQQYALTEAAYVSCRLVQEFAKVESRDASPWEESLTLTLCSANGVKLGFTAANP